MKLNSEKKRQIIEAYEAGQFTRMEIVKSFGISRSTVDRLLKGVNKKFRYDVLNNHPLSFDRLKQSGKEPGSQKYDPFVMLDSNPEFVKIVKCPSCSYRGRANKLLIHLINKHARYDLEYLLDEL